MPSVRVAFTALPAHVRTARLVALAVARRAGVADDLLDEVRLAVGEACSRAVTLNARHSPEKPVVMELSDERDRFTVSVTDATPASTTSTEALDELRADVVSQLSDDADEAPDDMVPAGLELAVIHGLVEDVAVSTDNGGTRVSMSWAASAVTLPAAE